MFDGHLRSQVDKRTGPIGAVLAKTPLSADSLTIAGILLSAIAGVVIAQGHFLIGFFLVVAGGIPDLLDGPLAKIKGTTSKRGAFFDSFSDRVSDLLLFGGLGWYFIKGPNPELAFLPFTIYGAASLISYQRAKAESLGFSAKGGIMERAERVAALAIGLLVSPLLMLILWVTLVLSLVTVGQRFVKIWNQASTTMVNVPKRYRKDHATIPKRALQRPELFRPRSSRSTHPRRRVGSSMGSTSFSKWLEQRGSGSFGPPKD